MIATDSVTANSRNNLPTIPPINRIGMNTAISDVLIDSTVNPISFDPSIAASNGDIPSSRCLLMFSITTIASSTTKPAEIANAIRHKLSTVYHHNTTTATEPTG